MNEAWDVCITTLEQHDPPRLKSPKQGWLSIPQVDALCTALDIQARCSHLAMLETEIEDPPRPTQKISVVICTYKRGDLLLNSMKSIAKQSFSSDDYELIIVNNDPDDNSVTKLVEETRCQFFKNREHKLKLVQCPFTGLSSARNAGISEASGQIVSFLDDDAIAKSDWLEQVWTAFKKYPQAGVVGGSITLEIPQPRPRWLKPRWEKFWSQFKPNYSEPTLVSEWWDFPWGANWSAKRTALLDIGGFRVNYGRQGSGFGGGEELVASSLIQRLGYEIVVNPSAEVFHIPESSRYTFQHVWRTIFASKITEYNIQTDFHLPIMKLSMISLLYKFFRYLVTAITKRDIYLHQRLEYLIYALAELKLMDKLINDLIARFRRPYI
jgi:glycosyltransferase involved in cell wall biosynthesis